MSDGFLKAFAIRHFPWLLGLTFWVRYALSPSFRHQFRSDITAYRKLRLEIGDNFRASAANKDADCALLFGFGRIGSCLLEKAMATGFELAGYSPVIIAPRFWYALKAYKLLGLGNVISTADYQTFLSDGKVDGILSQIETCSDLLNFVDDGVKVGKYAASTSMRRLRKSGVLDLQDSETHQVVREQLKLSLEAAECGRQMFQRFNPKIMLMSDRGYSPYGELFDLCLQRGIPVVVLNASHRSGQVVFKSYGQHNQEDHFLALSDKTWDQLKKIPWTADRAEALRDEIFDTYEQGDWYSEVGTQTNTKIVDNAHISESLGLAPNKKTAVIFPHIFWDATFFWGTDLFQDYEEWFCEVIKLAASKEDLNWIIKIHPANTVKDHRDNVFGEHSEVLAIRRTLGELPDHIKLLPSATDISTYSVFDVADYCLTVRGTVGIEAASRGIRTLTAGTGRYDRQGFTTDSDTRGEYLMKLGSLESIPPMSDEEIELARRYAYGTFLVRPTPLSSIDFEYGKDDKATLSTGMNCVNFDELRSAQDIVSLADWLRSGDDDFCRWPQQEGSV